MPRTLLDLSLKVPNPAISLNRLIDHIRTRQILSYVLSNQSIKQFILCFVGYIQQLWGNEAILRTDAEMIPPQPLTVLDDATAWIGSLPKATRGITLQRC
jgi:hypothetical protein